jgi:glyceraldehyde-3-phosphate dehydrogenase/erythrose-4-phosphate dehydrogenase
MQEEISAENLNAMKSQNVCEKENAKRVLYTADDNKQAARTQQISLGMPSMTLFTAGTISSAASCS